MISKNTNPAILFEISINVLFIVSVFLSFLSFWLFLLNQFDKTNKRPGINIKEL